MMVFIRAYLGDGTAVDFFFDRMSDAWDAKHHLEHARHVALPDSAPAALIRVEDPSPLPHALSAHLIGG